MTIAKRAEKRKQWIDDYVGRTERLKAINELRKKNEMWFDSAIVWALLLVVTIFFLI